MDKGKINFGVRSGGVFLATLLSLSCSSTTLGGIHMENNQEVIAKFEPQLSSEIEQKLEGEILKAKSQRKESVRIALMGNPGSGKTTFQSVFCDCDIEFTHPGGKESDATDKIVFSKTKSKYYFDNFGITDLPGLYKKTSNVVQKGLETSYLMRKHLQEYEYNAILYFIAYDGKRDIGKRGIEEFRETMEPLIKSGYENIMIVFSKLDFIEEKGRIDFANSFKEAFNQKEDLREYKIFHMSNIDKDYAEEAKAELDRFDEEYGNDDPDFLQRVLSKTKKIFSKQEKLHQEYLDSVIFEVYSEAKKMTPSTLEIGSQTFRRCFNTIWNDDDFVPVQNEYIRIIDEINYDCLDKKFEKDKLNAKILDFLEKEYEPMMTAVIKNLKKQNVRDEAHVLWLYNILKLKSIRMCCYWDSKNNYEENLFEKINKLTDGSVYSGKSGKIINSIDVNR